jgi:hypothetical protein
MTYPKNRVHMVCCFDDAAKCEKHFGVKYEIDYVTCRWVYTYPSEQRLIDAQLFLRRLNKNNPLYATPWCAESAF